jgi:serralysin
MRIFGQTDIGSDILTSASGGGSSAPGAVEVELTGDPSIDDLLGGHKWDTTSLGYTFPSKASFYPDDYAETDGFLSATSTLRYTVQKALENYSDVCLLKFTELAPDNKSAALNIGMTCLDDENGNKQYDGLTYGPEQKHSGDVWIHRQYESASAYYFDTKLTNVVLHEIGHAVGLKHPHEGSEGIIDPPRIHDQHEFSIMTYRSYYQAPLGARNDVWSFPQSLMMDDIAALQYMYGANFGTRSGDTTYSFDPVDGRMSIDGIPQGQKSGSKIFCTIWDGGGHDTYDFSAYPYELKVDLTPGGWSTLNSAQLPNLGDNRVADGSVFNARLYHGDTHSMIEDAKGGSASDMITGNFLGNALYGNDGNDSLFGMNGDDLLAGGNGDDILRGGDNADRLFGEAGNDTLIGEQGADALDGGLNNDLLYGGGESDTLNGGQGNDRLFGGGGNDLVYGDEGADRVVGEAGNDDLYGGTEDDTFYFRRGSGADRVHDFTPGGTEDTIEIGYSRIDTFAELLAATYDTDEGCVIWISPTTSVTLVGVGRSQLTAADFHVPITLGDDISVVMG